MASVTKRELNQQTATVLEQAAAADVVVTERGLPRWRISVFRDDDASLARMERAGSYTPPARTPAPWPKLPGGPSRTSAEVDTLLDELKGDH